MKAFYVARIIFRISNSREGVPAQFDEQFRIIQAANFDEAWTKATAIGYSEVSSFANDSGKVISWEFVNVCDLRPLESIEDGAELYSTIAEPADESSYISLVNARASAVKDKLHELFPLGFE
jgi:hypothetical protein